MGGRGQHFIVAAWAFVALVLSGVLCFVPLFDLLGYELALAVTAFAAVCSLHLGQKAVVLARVRGRAYAETIDAHPLRGLLALATQAFGRTLLVLLVPLLVVSLNVVRVKSCNPGLGVAWYLALPVPTAALGASYGIALGTLRVRPALLVAFIVPLIALAWSLARVYLAPPIFVFDPLLGYFAGSVYDERVNVPSALVLARMWTLVLAFAALAMASPLLDGATLTQKWRARRRPVLATLAFAAALAGYLLGPKLGYREDARTIARALGGERTTRHFVLHYSEGGPFARELDDVATELEFRWAELEQSLGHAPTVKVHAYLFSSAADKQTLMGAGHTYIAKPWRREIYVNYEAFPQLILGHELAHVFGADDGDWLLGMPRVGVRLDVGLTEGFAEALVWQNTTLTSDEAVAVLDKLGRLSPLDVVMSPAFWSLPAQQGYAIAGSFCHFLLERSDAKKLRALYRAGGARASYAAIYGKSFDALRSEWIAMIRGLELEPGVLERERDRLLRPSIFHRPCARELARRLELAHAASGRGDHKGAEALYEWVCADEPDDPGHLEDLLGELVRAGDAKGARAIAERLLRHPKTSLAQRAGTWSTLGDLAVVQHAWIDAAADFRSAEAFPTDEAQGRLYTVKRVLAERLSNHLDEVLVSLITTLVKPTGDAPIDFMRLTTPAALTPNDALLVYLAARQLANKALYLEAEPLLDRALAGSLPDDRFHYEALRMRAESAFRRRDYVEAETRWTALTTIGSRGSRIDAMRWVRRARFFRIGAL